MNGGHTCRATRLASFAICSPKSKESSLADYTDWVEAQGDSLSETNGRGDTKKIYEVVDALKGKSSKPPANLTTDDQGNPLSSAEEVVDR